MKNEKVLASASTLWDIEQLVNKYFYSNSYEVNYTGDEHFIHRIYHYEDVIPDYYVRYKRFKNYGRYYFCKVIDD